MKNENASKLRKMLIAILFFGVGIIIGGYLFSDTQPRSFLALNHCDKTCLQPKELIGLVNSVVVQKSPNLIPQVVIETNKSIAIKHPAPQSPIHYVVFPKRDIKNFGQLADGDQEYLIDTFAVLSQLIRQNKLKEYQIITNGPDYQGTTYLHFHLRAER